MCSEEVWCLQDLPQFFQPSQISPLKKGKTQELQRKEKKTNAMQRVDESQWRSHSPQCAYWNQQSCPVLPPLALCFWSFWSLCDILHLTSAKETFQQINAQCEATRHVLLQKNKWHPFDEVWSLPWILRCGNPEMLWSSASPSTACTWFSAPPAGLAPGPLGPPGPQPPSSQTCLYGAGAAPWPPAALPRGTCCEGQSLTVILTENV